MCTIVAIIILGVEPNREVGKGLPSPQHVLRTKMLLSGLLPASGPFQPNMRESAVYHKV